MNVLRFEKGRDLVPGGSCDPVVDGVGGFFGVIKVDGVRFDISRKRFLGEGCIEAQILGGENRIGYSQLGEVVRLIQKCHQIGEESWIAFLDRPDDLILGVISSC